MDRDVTVKVLTLTGVLSRELQRLRHVFPHGVMVYSSPTASRFLDASAQFGTEWPSRMTWLMTGDGLWAQVENISDYRNAVPLAST